MTKFPYDHCNLCPVITSEQVLEHLTATDGRTWVQRFGLNMFSYAGGNPIFFGAWSVSIHSYDMLDNYEDGETVVAAMDGRRLKL